MGSPRWEHFFSQFSLLSHTFKHAHSQQSFQIRRTHGLSNKFRTASSFHLCALSQLLGGCASSFPLFVYSCTCVIVPYCCSTGMIFCNFSSTSVFRLTYKTLSVSLSPRSITCSTETFYFKFLCNFISCMETVPFTPTFQYNNQILLILPLKLSLTFKEVK